MPRLLAVVLALVLSDAAGAQTDSVSVLVDALATDSNQTSLDAARELAATGDVRAVAVLESLVAGQLYVRRSDRKVVLGRREGRGYAISDPSTGGALEVVSRRAVSRLKMSASDRDVLRELIVELQLGAPDATSRRLALDAMLQDGTAIAQSVLDRRLVEEEDSAVRRRLEIFKLFDDLDQSSLDTRLAAIDRLAQFSHPAVRARLDSIVTDPGTDEALREAAAASLRKIDRRLGWFDRLQTLYFGISLGSVLVLAAIGLAITFGVMGVINMAHGELIMIGAYTTWGVQTLMPGTPGLALVLSIPLAFLISGSVGVVIERSVVRHLYQRPAETLLATFGISLILQQSVRSLFGPLNRSVVTPDWMSGSLEVVAGLSLTYNRLAIIGFCLLVFALLLLLINRSRFGLELRAVAQNRQMAQALGVNSARVDALTFALGSGVAGIAGVALSQLTNVGPNLGQSYIVDSFLVVVVGGVGNLWGTLVAGLSIGIGNKVLEPMTGAVLAKILLLVGIILFIQKRPRGLFPQRGRVVDV